MAKICTLFSGSRGNSTYISSGKEAILIDAGMSCRQILCALQNNMVSKEDIKAIFITHAHTDHINALRVLLKNINVPVYASKETLGQLILENVIGKDSVCFDIESKPDLPINMQVNFFRTSHDCEGSGGYVVTLNDQQKIALCTDLGVVTDEIRAKLKGCRAVILESNHDVGMLQNGSYPFATKQRILSSEGHLSNVSCAEELPILVENGTTHFVLAHLSRENNTPDLARVTAESVLTTKGIKSGIDCSLYVAPPSGGKMIYI